MSTSGPERRAALLTGLKNLRTQSDADALSGAFSGPLGVLLFAGERRFRNAPDLPYEFRCSSHVLYYAGALPPGSLLLIAEDSCCAFLPELDLHDQLWHGEAETAGALCERSGLDQVRTVREAADALARCGQVYTLTPIDSETREAQRAFLTGLRPAAMRKKICSDSESLIETILLQRLFPTRLDGGS